jgi:RNA polymerase subunit RPABC4/transcription elongation factor Spt4/F0F1-type ATP synthase membrane subunit c/vacuolar-type H+-ATPase subunit K
LETIIKLGLAGVGAFLAALWVALILWTYRDISSRTRDMLVQILATAMVAVLGIFGVLIYLMIRPSETLQDAYNRVLEEETLLREVEEQQVCPTCRRKTEEDYLLCPNCKTQLKMACPACGRLLHLRWDTCPYCAHESSFERPTRLRATAP